MSSPGQDLPEMPWSQPSLFWEDGPAQEITVVGF